MQRRTVTLLQRRHGQGKGGHGEDEDEAKEGEHVVDGCDGLWMDGFGSRRLPFPPLYAALPEDG